MVNDPINLLRQNLQFQPPPPPSKSARPTIVLRRLEGSRSFQRNLWPASISFSRLELAPRGRSGYGAEGPTPPRSEVGAIELLHVVAPSVGLQLHYLQGSHKSLNQ